MSRILKDYGKSIRNRLLNVAKEEKVVYQTILTRFFQERLLYRISKSQYKENFYLKGGALMYAYEQISARPTMDIDFMGKDISNDGEKIAKTFHEICAIDCKEDGVTFDLDKITYENITESKDYHGIRLSIPVKMDTITQTMSMDIGFGDVVTPEAVPLDYPAILENIPTANILAYSIETVIAEKMHAVIDLADQSSRMKDYYDLYQILSSMPYNSEVLQEAIKHTFTNRHTNYSSDTMFFRNEYPDNVEMKTRWTAFLKKIAVKKDLQFSEVVKYLQSILRPYWESLNPMHESVGK